MTESLENDSSLQQLAAPTMLRTYWTVVLGSFWRSIANRLALAFIGLLVLITVVVPFLANGQPFSILLKNQSGLFVRHWPLFSTLSPIDLSVFVFAAALLCYTFFHQRAKRRREIEQIRAVRYLAGGILFSIATLAAIAIFIFYTPYNSPYDFRDYQQLLQTNQATDAVFAPIPWHFGDQEPLISDRINEFPSHDHWLGTDQIGRDVLSRLLWSTRVVMGIGFISEGIALVIGVIMGALIGYFSRSVDLIGMRLVEVFESIPTFFLILIFIALYGRQIFIIMIILGLTGWTGIARFVRAEFLRLRNLDFVHAATAAGLPLRRILFRHMLPNGLTPIIVSFTFGVAGAIMSESGLSFLGIGVEPPTPSWGVMLNDAGNPSEAFRWWLALPPGLMIFFTVFAYNILGEGLRDALDPRTNNLE